MEAGHHGWLDPPTYPELIYTGIYYGRGSPGMVGSSEVNFSPSLSITTCMATMRPEPSHLTISQLDHRVFPRELTAFFCARFLSFS
jgi:hypothetical protein